MSFQVGRPVSDEAITRGVRFVKTVVREVEQLTPKLFGNFFGRATDFNRAFNKLWFYLVHEVDFFLTNGFAERIGLATGKTAPFTRNLHELLLINHNTVSIFEGVFEAGMEVSDRLLAVFAANEAVDELHWARAVEGHHSDNVLEAVRLEVLQITFHAGRFQLEDASRLGTLEKLISLLIVERQSIHVDVFVIDFANHTKSVVNHGKVREAEKVHLEKAEFLNLRARILSCERAFRTNFHREELH